MASDGKYFTHTSSRNHYCCVSLISEQISIYTLCVLIYTETRVGFARIMYTVIEGDSIEVCVRAIGDGDIGNEDIYLEVAIQTADNQGSLFTGESPASELVS